jgi:hypothetical protein
VESSELTYAGMEDGSQIGSQIGGRPGDSLDSDFLQNATMQLAFRMSCRIGFVPLSTLPRLPGSRLPDVALTRRFSTKKAEFGGPLTKPYVRDNSSI